MASGNSLLRASTALVLLSTLVGCSGAEGMATPPSVGGTSNSVGGMSALDTTTQSGGGTGTTGGASANVGTGGSPTNDTGGTTQMGGSSTTGGTNATGGRSNTGGSQSSGGSVSTGGSKPTGGASATGGSKPAGGASATGGSKPTGGASTTGGSKPTGGTSATGGSTPTGGASATGGSKPTGGASATGGSKPTGGASATGGSSASSASSCSSLTTGQCPARGSLTCPFGGGTDASSNAQCGCYTVSGLGPNKKAILDAGASQASADQTYVQYLLASAMMETEKSDTNYTLGDGKTGDSFNAGVAKQNLGMIKQCHPAIQTTTQAAQMNSDRNLDVQVYVECRKFFGDKWWAGHRNGSSGLSNPNTTDIQNFKAGEDWTNQQIQNGHHQCDDVRFWVTMPAIIIR